MAFVMAEERALVMAIIRTSRRDGFALNHVESAEGAARR
jgi:hypothetical protein